MVLTGVFIVFIPVGIFVVVFVVIVILITIVILVTVLLVVTVTVSVLIAVTRVLLCFFWRGEVASFGCRAATSTAA